MVSDMPQSAGGVNEVGVLYYYFVAFPLPLLQLSTHIFTCKLALPRGDISVPRLFNASLQCTIPYHMRK